MFSDYNMNYYGFNGYDYRGDYSYRNTNQFNVINEELITLSQAIELIKQSVRDEKKDELFYSNLIEQATTEKDKEIIASIRDDERKHNKILRELYFNFTNQTIPQEMSIPEIDNSLSYVENLEKALFGELNAVVKYRRIMGTMPSGNSYTLIMSIMTDELRHASKYNFLIHTAK